MKILNYEIDNRELFFYTYCIMLAGLFFGTPPNFMDEHIDFSNSGAGGTISENQFPYPNLFMAFISNFGVILTFLSIGGIIMLGYNISQGIGIKEK